ncbi:MAG: LAGLIDADG family homing endonuclease [Nanoarchaeota archaeon]
MKISPQKAEIVGLLCAEGCHFICFSRYRGYSKNRGKYYIFNHKTERIEFSNTAVPLLKHFRKLMLNCYGESPEIKYREKNSDHKIRVIKKHLMNDLLLYSDYGHNKWSIPSCIQEGSRAVKSSFIRGVYEGDGTKLHWRGNQPYVEFHMSNMPGLNSMKKLLASLKINSSIYLSNSKLFIKGDKDVTRFAKIIKPKFKKVELS